MFFNQDHRFSRSGESVTRFNFATKKVALIEL